MADEEETSQNLFAFDFKTGMVVECPGEYNIVDYGVRYLHPANAGYVTIGDGLRHDTEIEYGHWDRLLKIIKEDELDSSGLDLILEGWLGGSFPDEVSKKTFVDAVKFGVIKPVSAYLSYSD